MDIFVGVELGLRVHLTEHLGFSGATLMNDLITDRPPPGGLIGALGFVFFMLELAVCMYSLSAFPELYLNGYIGKLATQPRLVAVYAGQL